MGSSTAVSVQEYLTTMYHPDCDYLDGELVERNVGEWDHSRLQALLSSYSISRERQFGIVVATEQRVQVTATRFRIPDILVLTALPDEQILQAPPLLCIEILSPEDRPAAMKTKLDDFFAFGVKYVWVIEPRTREAFIHTAGGSYGVTDGILRTANPDIAVPLAGL